MKGLSVVCPGCKQVFHETTDAFDPHRPANGAMVRLLDPWRKWGWCAFGNDGLSPEIAEKPSTYWSMMECPGCCAPLAPGGRLTVVGDEDQDDGKIQCEYCDYRCKPSAMKRHITMKHTEKTDG